MRLLLLFFAFNSKTGVRMEKHKEIFLLYFAIIHKTHLPNFQKTSGVTKNATILSNYCVRPNVATPLLLEKS